MVRKKRRGEKTSVSKPPIAINGGIAKEVAAVLVVLVIAAIPFCYGKYLEFNTNDPFDGGLYAYSGQCVVNGQKVGVDVFPSARPATLLVNVIGVRLFGYSEFGSKVIQLLMQVCAIGLMYYTVRRLYGILPAAVSVVLAAFYLSCPPFAKTGNVKEQFMIACMIVTACAFILNQYGGKWWWLLISGGAGVNIYYFKPTGVSVLIAILVFIIAQPLLRKRRWKEAGRDIVLLAAGTVVGFVPLMTFYFWQGRLSFFMKAFPASLVKLFIFGFIAYGLILFAYRLIIKAGGEKASTVIKKVPFKSIVSVVILFFVILASVALFAKRGPDTVFNKFRTNPVVGSVFMKVYRVTNPAKKMLKRVFSPQSGYIAGSKSVSIFSTQFAGVMQKYRAFVVPIGLSLLAIIWWLGGVFASFKKRKSPDDDDADPDIAAKRVDRFVLLLAIWWVLDMLFIWISPQNHVQYYLPLNSSAAMLAGFAVYKCKEKPWGFCCVLAIWLLVDLLLMWGLRRATVDGVVIKLVVIGVSVGIWLGAKNLKVPVVATIVLLMVCCVGTWYQWNKVNLKVFEDRVEAAKMKRVPVWEQLSHYIRDNSSQDDGLYVWGWYPGIYVQSQRFTPVTRMVAYSNMHADSPKTMVRRIEKMVGELKADPPKYIVDSQKIHYPYGDHPVFDLWPAWLSRSNGQVHTRFFRGQKYPQKKAFTVDEVKRYEEHTLNYMENMIRVVLTDLRRQGGAVNEEKAEKMAHNERLRHEAMLPLRNFVVENYAIVPVNAGGHVLFKRKAGVVD